MAMVEMGALAQQSDDLVRELDRHLADLARKLHVEKAALVSEFDNYLREGGHLGPAPFTKYQMSSGPRFLAALTIMIGRTRTRDLFKDFSAYILAKSSRKYNLK